MLLHLIFRWHENFHINHFFHQHNGLAIGNFPKPKNSRFPSIIFPLKVPMTFPVKGLEKFFLKYNPSLLIGVFESTISSAKTENEIPKTKKV